MSLAHAFDSLLHRGALPAQPPGPTHWLDTPRGRLRVQDTGGPGPVVLMVPDSPNVIEHHAPLVERLAPHARVICFDMPGFGFSRPGADYDHSLLRGAETVLGVMDALRLREAALHFSCANGFYAIAAAKLAPRRIRRLLLCQTPSMRAMRDWAYRRMPWMLRTPILGQAVMRARRRTVAHAWYAAALPHRKGLAEFRAIADHALCHGGCYCLASVVQALLKATDAELRGAKTPTTLLWGEADPSHIQTYPESLLELLPNAQIQRFADCGHFPELERPADYVEIALATLNA